MTEPKSKEELESEETFHRFAHGVPLQDKLESLSDFDLAKEELKIKGKVGETIFKNEWRRRERLEQYKLNEIIIEKQHELNLEIQRIQSKKTFWISLLMAIIGIVGVVIGVILANYLEKHQELLPQQTTQQNQAKTPRVLPELNKKLDVQESPSEKAEKAKVVSSQPPKIKEKIR